MTLKKWKAVLHAAHVLILLYGPVQGAEESCNPTGAAKDAYITPCVNNVTVQIGNLPKYRIIFCHSFNLSRPVAWYNGDDLVTTDTSQAIYQIYKMENLSYPASLAISNRVPMSVTRLRCDGVINDTLDDSHGPFINLTVVAYIEGSVVVLQENENSTEAFCVSPDKYSVSWFFGDKEVTTDTGEGVHQLFLSKNGYSGALLNFKKANESEAGCYICKSTATLNQSECVNVEAYVHANLEIVPNETYFDIQRLTGDKLEIGCILHDVRPYKVSWYRGNDLVQNDTGSVVYQNMSFDTAYLIVKEEVGFSYSGTYRCVAKWNGYEDDVKIALEVKGDFTLSLSPDTGEIKLVQDESPSSVDILCFSTLDVTIAWYGGEELVSDNVTAALHQNRAKINESILHVENDASPALSGVCTCRRIDSNDGINATVDVGIYERVDSNIPVTEASDEAWSWFTASAPITDIPGNSLTWYTEGLEVPADSVEDAFQLNYFTDGTAYASLIVSHHTSLSTYAIGFVNYVCIAADEVSRQASTVSITYAGYATLMLSIDGKSIHIVSGTTKSIECGSSNGTHALSWSDETDAVSTSPSAVYQIIDDVRSKATLYIQGSANVGNSGTYTCSVIDSDGIESKSIYVDIDQADDLSPGDIAAIVLGVILLLVICGATFLAYDIKRSGWSKAWLYRVLLGTNRVDSKDTEERKQSYVMTGDENINDFSGNKDVTSSGSHLKETELYTSGAGRENEAVYEEHDGDQEINTTPNGAAGLET